MEQRGLGFCLAQQFRHVRLAGKVKQLMGLALAAAGQLHKGARSALGPLRVKIDQHFVHDNRQGRGMQGMIFYVGQPQGQIGLLARATAQIFRRYGFALRGQDGEAGVFQRGVDAAPALACDAGEDA